MKNSSLDWSKAGSVNKVIQLFRYHGLNTTFAVIASVIEDLYIRVFDRVYGVRTSGYIPLSQTSLEQNQASRGHRYRPVSAWALKRVIRAIAPSKELSFVDMGCGLGRACLIAADYGFNRVRGVDIVPEFCTMAKNNAKAFCNRGSKRSPIEILLKDAVDYSKHSDDDIIFLYNPFPVDILEHVINNLVDVARSKQKPTLIIYTERVIETSRTLEVLRQHESLVQVFMHSSWGQSFHVFQLEFEVTSDPSNKQSNAASLFPSPRNSQIQALFDRYEA